MPVRYFMNAQIVRSLFLICFVLQCSEINAKRTYAIFICSEEYSFQFSNLIKQHKRKKNMKLATK